VYVVTPGGTRGRGGIGRLVSYTARGWDAPGFSLTVLDSYGPGPRAWMPFYFAVAFLRLLIDALRGRVDLVHVNMAERLSVVRKGLVVHVAHALGVPVVLHLHGAEFVEYCRGLSASRRGKVARMMSKADKVVVLGSYWRTFVLQELGMSRDRVTVLHNAVPGPDVVPERDSGGPCRILFLGVVCERKGIDTLLAALALLPGDAAAWQVSIAGAGDVETYRLEAHQRGLGDRVNFLGWVEEGRARRLLAESDVLTLPSTNEGLPMAILEGMSYGLPVVATPVGSVGDAVVDGETGRLVPVGNPEALAAALRSLVEDRALRRELGQKARRRYETHFEFSAFTTKLAGIFHRAIEAAQSAQLAKASLAVERKRQTNLAAERPVTSEEK
jgi:glycosyltransferase involved in cell wall biosynthesis